MSAFTANSLLDRYLRMAPSDKKIFCIEKLSSVVSASDRSMKSSNARQRMESKLQSITQERGFVKLKVKVEREKQKIEDRRQGRGQSQGQGQGQGQGGGRP